MYQQDLSNLISCLMENGLKINETWNPGNMLRERIREIEALWHTRFHSGKDTPEISALRGFYEEFKSTYNKMLWACDENNYEQAFFVGYMLDRVTQEFLVNFSEPGAFPSIMNTLRKNDNEVVRNTCFHHERQLLRLLNRSGKEINFYRNSQAFRQHFLDKKP